MTQILSRVMKAVVMRVVAMRVVVIRDVMRSVKVNVQKNIEVNIIPKNAKMFKNVVTEKMVKMD